MEELIERFYAAFDRKDREAMAACYTEDARFSDPAFGDGRIAELDDAFSFHAWSRQALGAPGLLLGWTPVLRASVRRRARANLEQFMAAERS